MKNIQVVQIGKLGFNEERYGLVASGFSGRHIYSTAKKLVQQVKSLDCPQLVNPVKISGDKSDSWILVVVKDVQVNFLVEEYRYELDLEFRWLNRPTDNM